MSTEGKQRLGTLTLAALGVVYGDIGTSPLYALKEVFANPHHPVPLTPDNILGILSLVFWALILIVSIKYVAVILRVDNQGEGGIMALMALVRDQTHTPRGSSTLLLLGLFGAALFYGDGVITPAISVLSAIEGLEVITPTFKTWILPITLVILLGLFAVQKHGSGKIGAWFGPITTLWFLVLAGLGIWHISISPSVLLALSPYYALTFFIAHTHIAFFSLGSVFLVVTGTEALYADMGHFGRKPVQIAWLGLVLPALTLNYFGQGALLIQHPTLIDNPFYHLAPAWGVLPLVVLAAAATVIASQAVISGVYSITHQAIQLGYAPRMVVQHTASEAHGQIYLPGVNWALFLAVAVLVLAFGNSGAMAAAYGISVSGTMIITTVLVFMLAQRVWKWPLWKAMLMLGLFLAIDIGFFTANLSKLHDGGWFPLVFGLSLFTLMTTWKHGRDLLKAQRSHESMPLSPFVNSMEQSSVQTIPGTAVFLSPHRDQVPHALLHSLKHYKCLHARVVILTVNFTNTPYIPQSERVKIEALGGRFWLVEVSFGFMDRPELAQTLHNCATSEMGCDLDDTTFFLGHETLIARQGTMLEYWRKRLFIALSRNAGSRAAYFGLPPNRVVELGAQIVL